MRRVLVDSSGHILARVLLRFHEARFKKALFVLPTLKLRWLEVLRAPHKSILGLHLGLHLRLHLMLHLRLYFVELLHEHRLLFEVLLGDACERIYRLLILVRLPPVVATAINLVLAVILELAVCCLLLFGLLQILQGLSVQAGLLLQSLAHLAALPNLLLN